MAALTKGVSLTSGVSDTEDRRNTSKDSCSIRKKHHLEQTLRATVNLDTRELQSHICITDEVDRDAFSVAVRRHFPVPVT